MIGISKAVVWKHAKWEVLGKPPGEIWNRKRFVELTEYKRNTKVVRSFVHHAAVDRKYRDYIMEATDAWAKWSEFDLSPELLRDYLDAAVLIRKNELGL